MATATDETSEVDDLHSDCSAPPLDQLPYIHFVQDTPLHHKMAPTPNLKTLIAHYLATNYPQVLPAYIEAAQLPQPDPSNPPRPDLQSLVTEFYAQQASIDLAATTIHDDDKVYSGGSWAGWGVRDVMKIDMSPEVRLGGVKRTLEGISAANLLTVGVVKVPRRSFDTSIAGYVHSLFPLTLVLRLRRVSSLTIRYRATWPLSIITTSVDKTLRIIDYGSGEVSHAPLSRLRYIFC